MESSSEHISVAFSLAAMLKLALMKEWFGLNYLSKTFK